MVSILVVEDDAEIRALWAEALSGESCQVLTAPTGVEAVQMVGARQIDLVITDIMMPDKDGIETLLEIKKSHPEIKVVVVSGGGTVLPHSFLGSAELLGADATLEKPVSLKLLQDVVARLTSEVTEKPSWFYAH